MLVAVVGTAIPGPPVGQHPPQHDAMLIVEQDHSVGEQVGGGEWGLTVVELGEPDLGVGVDEGLLVDPATPFKVPT